MSVLRTRCVFILAVTVAQAFMPRGHAELINGIAAVVHDAVVTREELAALNEQTYGVLRRQYGGQPDVFDKKLAEMERENLDTLISRQLVLHEFKTAGYNLPESVLDDIVQQRIRAQPVDRVRLIKTLEAQGMTFEKYRQRIRDDFIVEALRGKNVSQGLIISPHKVEAYYLAHRDDPEYKVEDQIKLQMIVLNKSSDPAAPQAEKMAAEILSKLNEGASFEEMARNYNQGSQHNGDQGWVERSFFRKELADAAFALKPGQHSGVVDTVEACYLLRVQDARPAHTRPLSEMRDQIEQNLLLAEQKRLEKEWVDRLKKKTFVQYH
jgi:peptidyl-prolyl cis-trans isomerase SurA